jgi:DNA mismatch endonuclease (patch repair protein)
MKRSIDHLVCPKRNRYDAPSPSTAFRMRRTPQKDTAGELALRSALHRLGLRYRVDVKLWPSERHRVDIVFTRARVLVYFDGCFWHGCPSHFTLPSHNRAWWKHKITNNRNRDNRYQRFAEAQGWVVLRFWEHEDPNESAKQVASTVRGRLPHVGRLGR